MNKNLLFVCVLCDEINIIGSNIFDRDNLVCVACDVRLNVVNSHPRGILDVEVID